MIGSTPRSIRIAGFAALAALVATSGLADARLARVPTDSAGLVVIEATLPGEMALDCVDNPCTGSAMSPVVASALEREQTVARWFDRISAEVAGRSGGRQHARLIAHGPVDRATVPADCKPIGLVIGNTAYPAGLRLEAPKLDAERVAARFHDLGIETTSLIDADLKTLKAGISAFLDGAPENACLFVYYSGHGATVKGRRYLPAIDVNVGTPKTFADGSIDADELINRVGSVPGPSQIVLIDSHFPATYEGAR
ncbi:caspase family protein [Prosthecomicrobium hirschii]|uniref:caspase family protein n=1 Tax=Prosthecodimorpha hirschii TaxID=665126 RepID=UPI00222066DF|nr:caspase family protein [Prosthecomicrobium hirschii]MCW1839417.1 caspase family protein [Prosthecomicrobium hirschii]